MIERLTTLTDADLADLADLVAVLLDAVADGASIGFLPPFDEAAAAQWWRGIAADVSAGGRVLLVAREAGRIVGTVQLALADKPNAVHRAEVQKLLVHSRHRCRGLGRELMVAVEAAATACGRRLLVLDTATDAAERLYQRLGYVRAGAIPGFALNAAGGADPTVIYYRDLTDRP